MMILACDWFGTPGDVQLIHEFVGYWFGGEVQGLGDDDVTPANYEQVYLLKEDIYCEKSELHGKENIEAFGFSRC